MKKIILALTIALLAGITAASAEPTYRFAGRGAGVSSRSNQRGTAVYGSADVYGAARGTSTRSGSATGGTVAPFAPGARSVASPLTSPLEDNRLDPLPDNALYASNDNPDGWGGGFLEPPMPVGDAVLPLSLLALAFVVIRRRL